MAGSKKYLPLAAMEKIMKQAGAERVSDKAKAALKEVLEERAVQLAQRAVEFSRHTGRKTVKKGDIILAAKQ